MNIALVIAGGTGARMKQDVPKQFLSIRNKPVIIYTLEVFQGHPNIDGIEVVCVDGWEKILEAYCGQFNITKLENIVSGDKFGQGSIRNGLLDLQTRHGENDIILVHDAIRPLVSYEIISDCIRVCEQNGNAISAISCVEAIMSTDDGCSSHKQISRDKLKRTQTPQAMFLGDFIRLHDDAIKQGIFNSVSTYTLLIEMGYTCYISAGSEKNIKLTTIEDLDIFNALLNVEHEKWLK